MNPIRPSVVPPAPQAAASAQDAAKMAAARAFFAAAMGQGPEAAPVRSVAAAPPSTPVMQAASTSADAPQKVLRPGSLIDIRV